MTGHQTNYYTKRDRNTLLLEKTLEEVMAEKLLGGKIG
jgi:hypothetical protein